jgi:hypothetical protein
MREVLGQMDLDMLEKVFEKFLLNLPTEDELRWAKRARGGPIEMTLEELMVEILICENHL